MKVFSLSTKTIRKEHIDFEQPGFTSGQGAFETMSTWTYNKSLRTDTEEYFEFTHEQHLSASSPASNRSSKVTDVKHTDFRLRRFAKLLRNRSLNGRRDIIDNIGNDENCDGNRSLNSAANFTVGSLETVKASNANKIGQQTTSQATKRNEESKNRWNPLKHIIRVKTIPLNFEKSSDVLRFQTSTEPIVNTIGRMRAQTEDPRGGVLHGQLVQSTPQKSKSTDNYSSVNGWNRGVRDMVDDSIRGRLYGVDMLFLGDGRFTSSVATSAAPWDTPFMHTFTGQRPHYSPQQIFDETLLSSSGQSTPEIMLDGFIPGPDGRWIVQVEVPREKLQIILKPLIKPLSQSTFKCMSDPPPPIHQTNQCHTLLDDCISSDSSIKLHDMIWGPDIPPTILTDLIGQTDDDTMHSLASRCSIPIDIDNDSFVIATKEHINAIHDIISGNLAKGQFAETCRILNFVLRGITVVTDPDLRFLKGALLHNLGIVQMWQDDTRQTAVFTFEKAIYERQKSLAPNHPDIVASLVRKAAVCFVTGDLKETISALEIALTATSPDHLLRAKVLNNLGVAYYFSRGGKPAIKEFIKSLEIQRSWLDSTMRKVATVYDAAIILCNMGKVYLELSEFEQSCNAYEDAILLLTSIFSKDHDFVLTCLSSLAVAKSQKGELNHALQILLGCLRSQQNRFGETSPASIDTSGLIGYMYAKNGEFGAALKFLSTVRKWQKANLNTQDPSLLKTKESIRILENRLGIVRSSSVAKVWV